MSAHLNEWLNLLFRWFHLIAGIMWIGTSFYFMWVDSHLAKPEVDKDGVEGELYMVHSGGYYLVEKRPFAANQMPSLLHWFKWEAYSTWISGFFLLGIVYYMGGGSYLVDPTVSKISVSAAIGIGIGLLVVSWLVYDLLWNSPLARFPKLTALISFVLLLGISYGLTRVFSPRAAYLHVGAMMGTLMAGNVLMRIIPFMKRMVDDAYAGREPDTSFGPRAKQRSVHNNYMTLPVIFLMLSNHFPSAYGHPYNWLILGGLVLVGAGVRHYFNTKSTSGKLSLVASICGFVALFFMTAPQPPTVSEQKIPFEQVQSVIHQRCTSCHSAHPSDPSFPVAPVGIMFDTPEQIQQMAARIKARAVDSKTMPLGNKTGMTETERALLAQWIAGGALVK